MSTTHLELDSRPVLTTQGPDKTPSRAPIGRRLTILLLVLIPFLGLLCAFVMLWGWGFHWLELGMLAGMYLLSGLGISVGFHRLFTHRSFDTGLVVQFILAVLGSMAVQGPLLHWVAFHRRHHQFSDQHDDPHSPHHQGRGVRGILRGLWHAHVGWFLHPDPPNLFSYVKDLRQSRLLSMVSALFPMWVAIGMLAPAALGTLLIGGWPGFLLGLVWGGLVRTFFLQHMTWSVNSICHLWGSQAFRGHDQSRNNVVLGVLALGEGWHNNHHAFPTSARHGFKWWQLDLSYLVIRALALLGLAWNVKLPAAAG